MKKLLNVSFAYAVLAMCGGVFYREFTRLHGFEGQTTLSFVHTHLFLLGMFFFLLCVLLERAFRLSDQKHFGTFFVIYNLGLIVTAAMLAVRGVCQVLGAGLTSGMDAGISGIAGFGHILLGVGIILFFVLLRRCVLKRKKTA
ncbi:DUF2871 domain-containing protein [Candidatus Soleaferrea massiliensis]|uniref:DUF2871 domain-containing protein n=1 Tax=Candidatus Soleaferrea massiliensis TaxID=1470354 RepID=UPI0018CDE9D4|nr:DUF2871 domain-containing protein [Candidatus Soleaferrea massiliensis]